MAAHAALTQSNWELLSVHLEMKKTTQFLELLETQQSTEQWSALVLLFFPPEND